MSDKKFYEVLDTPDRTDAGISVLVVRPTDGFDEVIAFKGDTLWLTEDGAEEYLRGGLIKLSEEQSTGDHIMTPKAFEAPHYGKEWEEVEPEEAEPGEVVYHTAAAGEWQLQMEALSLQPAAAKLEERDLASVAAILSQPVIQAMTLAGLAEAEFAN